MHSSKSASKDRADRALMVGAPAILMLLASSHPLTHRREPVGWLEALLVLGLALAPLVLWLGKVKHEVGARLGAHSR